MPLVAKAEVGDLGTVVGAEEKVAQLQIPVHHAPLGGSAAEPRPAGGTGFGLPLRQAAFGLQVGEQVSSTDVLHYYK